jgi:hypothetical protein
MQWGRPLTDLTLLRQIHATVAIALVRIGPGQIENAIARS